MSDPIYDAVEGMAVAPVSNVYNLDELPANPAASDLPCRLLLPFGAGDNEQNMIEFMSSERNAWVETRLVDMMLFRHVAQGEGIETAAPETVAYARLYVRTFIANRYLDDTNQIYITGGTAKPGIVEYPSQSGIFYHGVLCTLTVREAVINP
jgi:hypothetical protein